MVKVKSKPITVLTIEIENDDIVGILNQLQEIFNKRFFTESSGMPFLIQAKNGVSETTLKTVEEFLRRKGLKPLLKVPEKEENLRKPAEVELEDVKSSSVLVINKDLRSGQMVEHFGDVILIGDLNPGAEIRATGNIIVFGKLKGIAWAGYLGNTDAVIVALRMQPQQLRIANVFAIPDEEEENTSERAEVARIKDDEIVLEPLG